VIRTFNADFFNINPKTQDENFHSNFSCQILEGFAIHLLSSNDKQIKQVSYSFSKVPKQI